MSVQKGDDPNTNEQNTPCGKHPRWLDVEMRANENRRNNDDHPYQYGPSLSELNPTESSKLLRFGFKMHFAPTGFGHLWFPKLEWRCYSVSAMQ